MSRNSARRNRNKQAQPNKPPEQQANHQNASPPMNIGPSFVVPTEFVNLPTAGKFYADGNSLKGVEKVEIKYMTAREEDILVNQDYIARGVVLDKLIESLIVDKSIKISDISDADKIAILVHARKTGYGNLYQMKGTCNNCNTEQTFSFDLEELIANAEKDTIEIPDGIVISEENNTFNFDLPISKYKVFCRVLNNEDFQYLTELEKQRKKHGLDFNYTVEFLRRMIVEVREPNFQSTSIPITDPEIISQFLDFIPALDSKKLKMTHTSLTPSFRMHQETACPACGHEAEREVPFSWAWFWSN
jgi:hypothetical protein|tara:strand:+ start:15704 stop:16612 length:909 start_codon:yes stop_codon:yes gene_type:complete